MKNEKDKNQEDVWKDGSGHPAVLGSVFEFRLLNSDFCLLTSGFTFTDVYASFH